MKRTILADLHKAFESSPVDGVGLFFSSPIGHMVGCLRLIEPLHDGRSVDANGNLIDSTLYLNMICHLELVTIQTAQGAGATFMPVVMPWYFDGVMTPKFSQLLGCTILAEDQDLSPELLNLQSQYTRALLNYKANKNGLKLSN